MVFQRAGFTLYLVCNVVEEFPDRLGVEMVEDRPRMSRSTPKNIRETFDFHQGIENVFSFRNFYPDHLVILFSDRSITSSKLPNVSGVSLRDSVSNVRVGLGSVTAGSTDS